MSDWYAPNQQAVRADGSGPAEEGTGGPRPKRRQPGKARAEDRADPVDKPETKERAKR